MNKNLKKVISSVAALALSASAVSAFAANFPDVPADASYAQAVQELSALDVISGFDDGTFKPDELVTRAQITKMIVDALNERDMAEASKANSKFGDVATDHWAKGYINQGVSDGFISGYSDTEFGPEDNVTYVQAQSMLVRAIGYETYAQGSGGWPNGYKTWASSQGITTGISGIGDDTQLTRAQVAQLVDNAMGAPVCVIKDYTTTDSGRRVPNLDIKDDEGKDYQTLFTKKHNAYKVYGRVTKTNKTDSGAIDSDQVEYRVEKADNFDDRWIGTSNNAEDPEAITAYIGETNAPDYLLTYSQALIQKDNNDEYTILSITGAAASKSVALASEDFDMNTTEKNKNADGTYTKLYFYPAGTTRNSVKHTIDPTADDYAVYVNGVERTDLANNTAALVAYLDADDTLSVTLEKQTNIGTTSTNTDYNLINITSYDTAIVSEIVERNDRITINFDDQSINKSRMIVYLDDDSYTYTFRNANGDAVDPADLKEDDVLSIAWNTTVDFDKSDFYDVIVSTDTVEEVQCKSSSVADNEYSFDNNETYKIATGMNTTVDLSSTYTLYLDHFGRIAKADENSVNKKIAVLKNIYKKAGGDWYAQIITKEGEEIEYKIDDDKAEAAQKDILGLSALTTDGVVYNSTNKTKIASYPNQVIEYSISSTSNKITIKDQLVGNPSGGTVAAPTKEEYRASSNKLGGIKLNDATTILDLSEANDDDYDVVSLDNLVDGNSYQAVGYDETNSGTKYHRFVILLSGATDFTSESQLAVVRKVESVNDDDTTKVQLKLAYKGDEEIFIVDDSVSTNVSDFYEGEPILFTTNAAGYIKKIAPVFNDAGKTAIGSYANMLAAFKKGTAIINEGYGNEKWNTLLEDGNSDDIDIVTGVAADRNGSNLVIGPVATGVAVTEKNNKTTIANGIDYDVRNNEFDISKATIYTYDFDASTQKGASKVSLDDGILATPNVKNAEYTATAEAVKNHTILDLDDDEVSEDIVFAVARVDGDEVQELYLFYQED